MECLLCNSNNYQLEEFNNKLISESVLSKLISQSSVKPILEADGRKKLYQKGIPSRYFMVILTGKVKVLDGEPFLMFHFWLCGQAVQKFIKVLLMCWEGKPWFTILLFPTLTSLFLSFRHDCFWYQETDTLLQSRRGLCLPLLGLLG